MRFHNPAIITGTLNETSYIYVSVGFQVHCLEYVVELNVHKNENLLPVFFLFEVSVKAVVLKEAHFGFHGSMSGYYGINFVVFQALFIWSLVLSLSTSVNLKVENGFPSVQSY